MPYTSEVSGAGVKELPDVAPLEAAQSSAGANLWAVVFAGGIGSRFWPLSSPTRPKQLLALVDERPLIADTIGRLAPLIPPERVIVLTSRDIAAAIHAAIPQVPGSNMLAEPVPLGTAASLAWGVAEVKRRGGSAATICAVHADLAISFLELFHEALAAAAAIAAKQESIVLLGVAPTRNDESFGYVSLGQPLDLDSRGGSAAKTANLFAVRRFHEKPDAALASDLVSRGALWHTGILVANAGRIERELKWLTPEVSELWGPALAGHSEGLSKLAPTISLERGLLERSTALVVLRGDFGWDDVGTWASLRRARELDDAGNGIIGPAQVIDSTANIVHTQHGDAVLYGVSNLLVVRLRGLTFVTTLDRARDLRSLLEELPAEVRMRMED